MNILVTGATGYIGGRLVPELLARNHKVRCLVRTPDKLVGLAWHSEIEVARGDLSESASLSEAFEGVDTVFHLVHSMSESRNGGFGARDRAIARNVRRAAEAAGCSRIVYLGGLGDDNDPNLSKHLRSRHEVGEILADGPVPVTELRAAVIIGSGSASFEMLRHIVEKLPVMITPHWLGTRCQPIAIRDVLHYLCQTVETSDTIGKTIEIGGPDVLTYEAMMQIYAEETHLRRRRIVKLPLLTPSLSSHWIGFVTPLPTTLAKPLVHGLLNEVVVKDHSVDLLMTHECLTFRRSVQLAIQRTRDLEVSTSWASAELYGRSPADPMPTDPEWSGGTILDDVQVVTSKKADPHDVYRMLTGIGGDRGWYVTDFLWEVRGWIDKAVGGVGMRRGRRHPDQLRVGDPLDFWRVEALVPDTLVRLHAEMRLPGKAWLEWMISDDDEETKLTQRARYQPRGIAGRIYWYSLRPFHGIIFKGLARALMKDAEKANTGLSAGN